MYAVGGLAWASPPPLRPVPFSARFLLAQTVLTDNPVTCNVLLYMFFFLSCILSGQDKHCGKQQVSSPAGRLAKLCDFGISCKVCMCVFTIFHHGYSMMTERLGGIRGLDEPRSCVAGPAASRAHAFFLVCVFVPRRIALHAVISWTTHVFSSVK